MRHNTDPSYNCFCGETFEARDGLIEHNVRSHGWSLGDSRIAVRDKYPE